MKDGEEMEEFNNLINTFILSGGVGFISYYILAQKGDVNIRKEGKEDKALFILFFSVINMGFYQFFLFLVPQIQSYLSNAGYLKSWDNKYLFQALAIGLTIITSVYFSLYLYPVIGKKLNDKINEARTIKDDKSMITSYSPRELTLDKNYFTEVFIFSLNRVNGQREYISNGFVAHWSDIIDDRKQITLYPRQNAYKTKIFTEDEVLEKINHESVPENMARIYIDKDLEMIFYIFYYKQN